MKNIVEWRVSKPHASNFHLVQSLLDGRHIPLQAGPFQLYLSELSVDGVETWD